MRSLEIETVAEAPHAVFTRPDAEIYYEVHGSGFPLLLFAPAAEVTAPVLAVQSANPNAAAPWMDPMVALAAGSPWSHDQRNAGNSRGAVTETHGWHRTRAITSRSWITSGSVVRRDGWLIGGSYCLSLCELAPERVAAAVLQNPIGMHDTVTPGRRGERLRRDRHGA